MTATNVASTMLALMAGNPLAGALDLSALRILSCGGSPQSDAVVARAIALFGCEFFVSYGMTGASPPLPAALFWRPPQLPRCAHPPAAAPRS